MTLELDRLCVALRGQPPLFAPLSLSVAAGEVVTIMGPSGVGKSTLLDAIGGHLSHQFHCSGRILLNGADVTPLPAEARRIGILFQDALMFPHLSVAANLAFGLPATLRGRAARRDAVETALAQAGLAGFGPRDTASLSGGQKARVALMRTLLAEPRALLLDEPFSRLDESLRAETRSLVFALARDKAVPVLLVTHDPGDAEAAGGRVIGLAAGQSGSAAD